MQGNKGLVISVAVILVILAIVAGVVVGNKKDSNTSNSSMNMNQNSSASKESNQSTTPVQTNAVSIADFAFSPKSITVKVGDTVTWTNSDSAAHTVTADNPSADAPNSQQLSKGESYSFTFKRAGTYTYHCALHPYMKGTVTVTE